MRRALVLGAGGLLARELVPALSDWDVLPLRRADCDLTRPGDLERLPDGVVFNLAAYTAVDRAEAEPEAAFAVNATGAGNVARFCAARGLPLLHVSTDFVFDGAAGRPYTEVDEPRPLGVYGRSKRAGEEEVLASGARAWVVRTGGLYGHGGPSFFRAVLRRAAAGGALRVVRDHVASPTWTRDLARQLVTVASQAPPGLYHATAHGHASWHEAALRALRSAGLEVPVEPITAAEYGAPAPRPPFAVLDNAALRRLGLDVLRPWDEALVEWLASDLDL